MMTNFRWLSLLLVCGLLSCRTPIEDMVPRAAENPDGAVTEADQNVAATAESGDANQAVENSLSEKGEHSNDPPIECTAGVIAGLADYEVASLIGDVGKKIPISPWLGAAPGDSYGIVGDNVEVMASALVAQDGQCDRWVWVKWPQTGMKGWLPLSSVSWQETTFAGLAETLPSAKCNHYSPGTIIGLPEYETYQLQGNSRIGISSWFGWPPGESYGLPGDTILVLATAFEANCTQWALSKWPSGFRGWILTSHLAVKSPEEVTQ